MPVQTMEATMEATSEEIRDVTQGTNSVPRNRPIAAGQCVPPQPLRQTDYPSRYPSEDAYTHARMTREEAWHKAIDMLTTQFGPQMFNFDQVLSLAAYLRG